MPSEEQIDNVVVESFRRVHLEDREWAFRDEVLEVAKQVTAEEGLLGETIEYRLGSYVLGLLGREPGPFLQKRRYARFVIDHWDPAVDRLVKARKLEGRREPREDKGFKRRIQYSLTDMHPLYGSPAYRER